MKKTVMTILLLLFVGVVIGQNMYKLDTQQIRCMNSNIFIYNQSYEFANIVYSDNIVTPNIKNDCTMTFTIWHNGVMVGMTTIKPLQYQIAIMNGGFIVRLDELKIGGKGESIDGKHSYIK